MSIVLIFIIIATLIFVAYLFLLKHVSNIGKGLAQKHMDKWGMNYSDENGRSDEK